MIRKEYDYRVYDESNQTVTINQNRPSFSFEELSLENGVWDSYSELDAQNRVGVANAMLGKELFPKEKRLERLTVSPTGWKQKKTKKVEGGWLYNRSHLIGFQLTGQNDNPLNLMTGTRSFNTPNMLVYENDIIHYIKSTGNHVRYRVSPMFQTNELVARGVQLEAQSIEDNDLAFNVIVWNIQEGFTINYNDGTSREN